MSTMSERVYSIEYFQKILDNGFDYKLPESTMALINKISSQVGDPTYIKTPIFKKNVRHTNRKKNRSQKPLTDEQWQELRNFEKTKIIKNEEGIHKYINQLRNKLNKLTNTTYDDVIFEVKQIMSEMMELMNTRDYTILHNTIYDICSGNTFYSNIFTKLYVFMVHTYEGFKQEYELRFNNDPVLILYEFDKKHDLEALYNKMTTSDNYDDLCKLNLIHDKKQALCKFVGNLITYNMFSSTTVYKFIDDFIQEYEGNIDINNNSRRCEDLSEMIYEIILTCKSYLSTTDTDSYEEITEEIEMISELATKDHPSLTNKCVFKFMDLLDGLNE